MTSKTNLKCKFGEIILGQIIPELVFRRTVGMMLQLIKMFFHIPLVLLVSPFHDDGTMTKSCKSDLMKQMCLLSSLYLILIDLSQHIKEMP